MRATRVHGRTGFLNPMSLVFSCCPEQEEVAVTDSD